MARAAGHYYHCDGMTKEETLLHFLVMFDAKEGSFLTVLARHTPPNGFRYTYRSQSEDIVKKILF